MLSRGRTRRSGCGWRVRCRRIRVGMSALRDVYDSTGRRQAERELADWHRWAAVYDIEETNRLAGTVRLAVIEDHLNTMPRKLHDWHSAHSVYAERTCIHRWSSPTNNLFQVLRRTAHGFTNPTNFQARGLLIT